jgi:hypothetical protein
MHPRRIRVFENVLGCPSRIGNPATVPGQHSFEMTIAIFVTKQYVGWATSERTGRDLAFLAAG